MKFYGISYPRCGANWVRYICRHLLKIEEENKHWHVDTDEQTYCKTHELEDIKDHDRRLILIVRDYKECLIRHNNGVSDFGSMFEQNIKAYLDYFYFFNKWHGEKYIIYYEDLITKPKREIHKLGKFIKAKKNNIDRFMGNFKAHKFNSLEEYSVGITKGQNVDFWKLKLTIEDQKQWNDYVKKNHEGIFNQYLKRYYYEHST